ncbi:MAG: hypothetical protein C207_01073 [Bradyrhizobium sp. DFCI-1]|nr:MAG: hypothetical protein C207_01073 [Bradyrhizobium sp. DFCI-1]HAQ83365.1 hypothetical protein [Bradyrhizobium sp.]HAR17882.1 hypothetical protein [Bradyrhizobium sp.]HAR28987.1 hypothetical protein [Bradyrhizobium sp.]HBY29395.1 hypothetical protein [Bradyrhizobium sp.]
MTYSNLVFDGLAEGLKPRASDEPDAITVDLDALRAAERLRILKAVERRAELAETNLAVQRRIADAAARQAEALEIIVALFYSTIGVGNVTCGHESGVTQAVNFLRTGSGREDFRCDEDSVANADDSN